MRFACAELKPLAARILTSPSLLRYEPHRVRRQGYAIVGQALVVGPRSIAAPVRDRCGTGAAWWWRP